MELKVFAHRGEAQAFFKNHSLKAVNGGVTDLFSASDYLLLICGEGVQRTTERLTHTLALHPEITHVTNLGVAGGLNLKLEVMDIISLRTVYRQSDGEMEFKSFSTEGGEFDGITSHGRVLSTEEHQKLAPFGDVVDREAWAVGSVCHYFNLPFSVHKLISDMANQGGEICKWVKERAEEFSEKLFLFDQKTQHPEQIQTDFEFIEVEGLYFTLSQKRQFNSLLEGLKRKGLDRQSIFERVGLSSIMEDDILPKKKTTLLLKCMTELLNPFHAAVTKQLDELSDVFKSGQFKVHYDKNLESDTVQLHATISHQKHINDLISSLEEFRYDQVQQIFKGKLDV